MHIPPPEDLRPLAPLASRPSRRRRLLRPMLIGSVVLHLLLLVFMLWVQPEPDPEQAPQNSDEVPMVFENATGSPQASTPSPNPSPNPSVAAGSAVAPETTPTPDNMPPPPPMVASNTPPTPVTPPTPPTPPTPEAPPTAETAPPQPEVPPTPVTPTPPQPTQAPPPPTPTPPVPRPPPTVSLSEGDEPALPPPPAFRMPQPPPPLPPLPPRPAPPRVARTAPRNPSPLTNPQNWSLNSNSTEPSNGHPSRGFDLSMSNRGGPAASSLGYVSGAKPSGDWMSALRKWVDARKYYPDEAVAEMQQGNVSLLVDIDRSGRVLSVQLVGSSRSPFLDGAFQDLFRRAVVPPFTPDMTEQTTTLRATMHFVLQAR